ncbi:hypothetical protein [Chitinophaga defluvii]|uniref:Uncharacterized protein n=1 Tax=Chitinophaga defluvii TaxID=3163343 RepID=A0ABV2T9U2_9BACT
MRIFLSTLLGACLFFSSACQEEKAGPPRKFISFKLDSVIYLSENPAGILTVPNTTDNNPDNDYPTLLITGTSNRGDQIAFSLVSPTNILQPGFYESTQGNSMTITFNGGLSVIGASENTGIFALQILNVNGNVVEGTFTGILSDLYGSATPRVVSNGSFRAVYKQL